MTRHISFGSLLLLSSALVAPAALAQSGATQGAGSNTTPAQTATPDQPTADQADDPQEEIQVSAPGADAGDSDQEIVVVGRNIPNAIRSTPEVISVLSAEDIARTGEGDVAGALQRVTGLSVVGNGFVFVRGLGDRYSSALLNGSPLPSPEPLRRVVPLDIFPTSVIASAVVQKSYSVNYPGEFGGGVINLTSVSIPREPFFSFGVSGQVDTDTTGRLGYTYFGSDLDFLGFDDGTRDFPSGLRDAVTSGTFAQTTAAQRRDFAASLRNSETTIVQRNGDIPANFSADVSGGYTWEIGGGRVGVIAAAGYSSNWRTRDAIQQTSLDPELAGTPQTSFNTVITDNRVVVNGLLGLGVEFGDHEIRWTNLYIRDTLKQARLASGFNRSVQDQDPNLPPSVIEQNTYFFERQLIDTQLVGEFKFDDLSIDLRGTYAKSERESPYERDLSYTYLGDGNPSTKTSSDVDDYINNLSSIGQSANVAFNDLSENVYAGGIDFAYRFQGAFPTTISAGYAYNKTDRTSSRYQFQYFRPEGALPISVAQERPDFLLSDFNVYTYNIQLRDVSGAEGAAAYEADLRVHAGYAQAEIDFGETGLRGQFGVRYEDGVQRVQPIGAGTSASLIENDYFVPAATLTWNFAENMQLRAHASKTIARPQFRELAPQIFQDFESDREFTGNPFLQDSELFNAEARYEWYFARGQRFSLSGFYKKIDKPIEAAAFFAGGGQLRTGFANAPSANLYGAEVELQYYLPLEGLGDSFGTRRLLLIGNYTYTKSELKVDDSAIVGPNLQPLPANLLFQDGAPLTGQSDHLANLQIGIEDTDRISQATILITYASERVTNRGPIQGSARQPDIIEKPGFRLDFVAREAVELFGANAEIRFEARNLLRQDYEEFQKFEDRRIDINRYDLGATFSLGISFNL
ncbi:MAG TPA: TonB-dependent receptor [Allosphingosinicella sp.]|jgi:outer membrane receptor protein involved in Fe transport|uniref:TonB-dependent receptor domain-containing protein n=1 Tax=Allosphingosinicella sp. TaxID=2823234 RepID=UPI002F2836C4